MRKGHREPVKTRNPLSLGNRIRDHWKTYRTQGGVSCQWNQVWCPGGTSFSVLVIKGVSLCLRGVSSWDSDTCRVRPLDHFLLWKMILLSPTQRYIVSNFKRKVYTVRIYTRGGNHILRHSSLHNVETSEIDLGPKPRDNMEGTWMSCTPWGSSTVPSEDFQCTRVNIPVLKFKV